MAIFGLWVINKAGGLVYQRNFADGLAQLTSNEYLVLAGTLHGIHAITSRLSPTGSSSGAHVIEAETFKMTILLTPTGTKFVLLTSLAETSANAVLQKVYEAYADGVMKNPFHTPDMPIRSEVFDTKIAALIEPGHT
ncbi:transport protein particle complex subunit [Multifurca ochricompacta]|uniref:Trafficking protein particle complex subunit n=1 Tax=Multifurca ochricompacta TaxID=376703 RepID=A0AAD4M9F2_9AGAM|nr:transport protein particle complex subunit [Multifurca ochricompacta]